MPTTVNLPGGDTATFPDGMSTGDIEAVLAKQYRPASERNEDYGNEGRSRPVERNEAADEGTAARYWEGVKGGAARIRNEIFPPANPATLFQQDQAEAGQQVRARRASLAQYERTKDQLGTAGFLGDITPEMVASAVPLSRVGTVVSRLPLAMKVAGRYAPALADIGVNAAYEAGKSSLSGDDAGTVVGNAAMGGTGAAAGRVLVRALGGMKPLMSKGAQTLADEGVLPSMGQMFDGPLGTVARRTEDAATSIPGYGDTVLWARGRAARQFNENEINRALRPIGVEVKGAGDEAIAQAEQHVSNAYQRALPRTHLDPASTDAALHSWSLGQRPKGSEGAMRLDEIPLLSDGQRATVMGYIHKTVRPALEEAHLRGGVVDGDTVKRIDEQLGFFSRKFSSASDPSAHSLGEAFGALRDQLRAQLRGSDDFARSELARANDAYRRLLPVREAADRAARGGGQFTPLQMHRSAQKFGQDASAATAAGRTVLGDTVGDSGTGRRLMTAVLGAGAGAGLPLAAGGVLGVMLNNPMALRAFVHGVPGVRGLRDTLVPRTRDWFDALPDSKKKEFIERYAREVPSVHQMAAQIGRHLAMQQQQMEMAQ